MDQKINKRLIALALTSFLIYAAAVCLLGQHHSSQYNGEQFIIASALSHAQLGTPIGSVHWGVIKQFVYQPTGTVQSTISNILAHGLAQTELGAFWTTLPDGLGIVMASLVSIMFRLFGVTLAVFPALAVGVSAISVAAFMIRFRDGRLLAIAFHFFLLTALLLAPTSTDTPLNEFPIGGLRYFGLLAMLPAFHMMFELFDRRLEKLNAIEIAALATQVFIFVLCLNIRSASIYMLFGILTLIAMALWMKSGLLDRRTVVVKLCAVFSLLSLSAIFVYATAPQDYRNEGRVTGVFWHRILISLGTNPAWPFGDLAARYNLCALPYSHPMLSGVRDSNGGCIWTQHVLETKMTTGELVRGIGSAPYESTVRAGFFRIVVDYPYDVAKTFLYYKFAVAFDELKSFMSFRFDKIDQKYPFLFFCVLAQALVLAIAAWSQTTLQYRYIASIIAVFLAWSIVPLVIAWATMHTVVDLGYWCFAALACAILSLSEIVKAGMQRMSAWARPHAR